jgi:TolA-binding protein
MKRSVSPAPPLSPFTPISPYMMDLNSFDPDSKSPIPSSASSSSSDGKSTSTEMPTILLNNNSKPINEKEDLNNKIKQLQTEIHKMKLNEERMGTLIEQQHQSLYLQMMQLKVLSDYVTNLNYEMNVLKSCMMMKSPEKKDARPTNNDKK